MELKRAYSILNIKSVNEDERIIEGIATTPTPDRVGDIVEAEGAEFQLPIPLLWQHRSDSPVGNVFEAKVTAAGIRIKAQIANVPEPGDLKNQLDKAWQSLKHGLVRGLSIGFQSLEDSLIRDTYGYRYIKWMWLELSCVTIPANSEASILQIRSFDQAARGNPRSPVRLLPPANAGAPRSIQPPSTGALTHAKAVDTMAYGEMIARYAETQRVKSSRQKELVDQSGARGETMSAEEADEYDAISVELKAVDQHIGRLREIEARDMAAAGPVAGGTTGTSLAVIPGVTDPGAQSFAAPAIVRAAAPPLAKGLRMGRVARCLALAKLHGCTANDVAKALYPTDRVIGEMFTGGIFKAAVAAGSVDMTTWGDQLVGAETNAFTDFVEFLMPATIVGRLGTNGLPALAPAVFNTPLIAQTSSGTGYWVGEGRPIPLTRQAFTRTTLEPNKVAAITPITRELLQRSAPNIDAIIRDSLVRNMSLQIDLAFTDPTNSGQTDVKPASITYGLTGIASTGNDADSVREDLALLFAVADAADQPLDSAVFMMPTRIARRLSLMRNALGQREFPEATPMGGSIEGFPILASNSVPTGSNGSVVILMNAGDVYLGDEGGYEVDMSSEASLEMLDNPTNNVITPTPTTNVSLWQNNAVAFRGMRHLNWRRRRETAVAFLTGADWGSAGSS